MGWLDMLRNKRPPPEKGQPSQNANDEYAREALRLDREKEIVEIRRAMAEDRQRLIRLQAEADLTHVTHHHRRKGD